MRDVAVRPVMWTAFAIGLVVAVVVTAVLWLLHANQLPPGGDRLQFGYAQSLDAPGLSSAPQDELRRERERVRAHLEGAGWIDRQRGIAHIPIGDAMDLLVQQRAKEPPR